MDIVKINSVKDLHNLARFIVARYKLEALTEITQSEIYRKYSELTQDDVNPIKDFKEDKPHPQFAHFLSIVRDEAEKNGIEHSDQFVKDKVLSVFIVCRMGSELYDKIKSWGYSQTPTQLMGIARKDKLEETIQQRKDLQDAEDYLNEVIIALKGGLPPSELNKKDIAGVIQNIAYIKVKHSNVPLCAVLKIKDVKILESVLGSNSDEIKILQNYIETRDEILSNKGNLITSENRDLIIDDLLELKKWIEISEMPVLINPGGEDRTGISLLDDVIKSIREDKTERIHFVTSIMGDMIKILTHIRS